ncbi:SMEK domain-containing protein, partial [Salmonella enterica]|nr:SMEK domain-containing protein [Salmonella enterica]ECP1499463.1 SMEK domain-containing protein [Salmonella enterica]
MNRSIYFDLCEKRLTLLCYSVELRGKLNILNYNLHCEDFYVHFFNLLFGYSLKNTN